MSDVPFDEDLEFEIEGNSSKQQRGSGRPIMSSTVFHSLKLKAMQDVHLCMYVCMYACVYNFYSFKAMQDFHLCMCICM